MNGKQGWAGALLLLLLLQAVPASASENRVCYTPDGGNLRGPAVVGAAEWIGAMGIQGLDPNHWAAAAMVEMFERNEVQIVRGERVDPEGPVMLFQAAESVILWANRPMAGLDGRQIALRAAELDLIPGPVPEEDRPITRLEAAQMLAPWVGFKGEDPQPVDMSRVFSDWESIPAAKRDAAHWVTMDARLFVGYPDRTFRPNEPLTQAMFAVVLHRLRTYWVVGPAPVLGGP